MKNKYLTITLFILSIFLIIGISYAYFEITVSGNDNSKDMVVTAGTLELTFNDKDSVITLNNAKPGDYYTKTITVKNTGTLDTSYNLVWQELTNEITNDELVIEATCKQLNASNTEEGTCSPLSETPVSSNTILKKVSISPSYTHEYTIKVTFKEMNKSQNYNTNKTFKGKFGIEEYQKPNFSTDSWSEIIANVKAGNGSEYKVGSTKEVNLGTTYGTHILRIANTSTPSECSTTGFSQTACGFVLEFADIITTHSMNDTDTNVGGWPASSMYTFVNNDIYNAIPSEIKNAIIDTIVVSGHGITDTNNFTSTDKLYLLSTAEIWAVAVSSSNSINEVDDKLAVLPLGGDRGDSGFEYDQARDVTRQLDYYKNLGVTENNYSGAIKNNGTSASTLWLRSARSIVDNRFYTVSDNGGYGANFANIADGVAPAFRLG